MGFNNMLSVTEIASSGLSAERTRMEVIANNIANANTTRTPGGGPFRRQDVVFEAIYDRGFKAGAHGRHVPHGVRVAGIVDDPSEPTKVYAPGHPDADKDGFLSTPNVQLPLEMVNLLSASRAYEGNVRVLQMFRQMAESTLALGRSQS